MCTRPRPRPRAGLPVRWKAALLGGALGACLALLPFAALRRPPAAVVAWAVDRDADELLGLGAGGLVQRELATVAPVLAAPHPTGGLWVVEAVERRALGRHRLVRLWAGGRRRELGAFERASTESASGELTALPGAALRSRALSAAAGTVRTACLPAFRAGIADAEGLWLLLGTRSGEEALWRVEAGAAPRLAAALPGARLLARGPAALLLVVGRDELVLLGLAWPPSLSCRRRLGAGIVDVAPAPGGGWWVLTESEPRPASADVEAPATDLTARPSRRLLRLDGALRRRSVWPLAPEPWQLCASASCAWLFAPRSGRLLRTLGPPSPLLPEELPLERLSAVCPGPEGEVWLAGPGAVLALDRLGAPAWAQGGFERLVGLVPARVRGDR